MILSWVAFPLVLAAVGLGWGALVGWAAGERSLGALSIPLGLAAAIVVAGIFTMFSFSAPAAAPVVAFGALGGLARARGRAAIAIPALVAAVGVLLVYGAPVILSGEATFLGYVRLDDTATWLGFVDQFFAHGRSLSTLPSSTYELLLYTNLTSSGYPSGAFMLLGVGHWITGIDSAWIFQPYLAVCAAALALCCWELVAPVVKGGWLRAFVAFIAAQSALLFGYAAWGGIKELTAAFLFGLGMAAAAQLVALERPRARSMVPLAVAGGALIVTLGPGVIVYVGPVGLAVVGVLLWRWRAAGGSFNPWIAGAVLVVVAAALLVALLGVHSAIYVAPVAGVAAVAMVAWWRLHGGRPADGGALAAIVAVPLTALLALPSWPTLSPYLRANSAFAAVTSGGGASGAAAANHATAYGNLTSALRAIQLGGIWLDGDFRTWPTPPPSFANHLLIYVVFAGALFALGWTLWRRNLGLTLYVGVALISIVVLSLLGSVPWVMGKSLAISSPAVLLAGMTGGAILFNARQVLGVVAGVLALGAIAGGVLWSNYLQYHNVTLAPRARLSEFQTISKLIANRGPTFINDYEIYADRHFLRDGAPVEPAEYRPVYLPTLGNAFLTDSAWANIDSFGVSTLAPYRSLVIRLGPTEGRPPSIYGRAPVWTGTYYQLWQEPAKASVHVLTQVPFGDITSDAYCGMASNVTPPDQPLCPIAPAGVPACSKVRALASTAALDGGYLLAYERPNPIVVRGTDTQWSGGWDADPSSGTLTPTAAGATATATIVTPHVARDYQLWLGGSFIRGFVVSVDGRPLGSVSNQLNPPGDYNRIGAPLTLQPGRHTITVTYPQDNLSPGSADSELYTSLFAIALAPPTTQMHYVAVSAAHAQSLCGHLMDWIEVVAPA
ncbi:MAG: hypothetical protein ABSD82_14435 [Solirubrobacteraceae bacterium]